ncbi:MAG: acyltransferase [Actinomycetota bacterium]
MAGEPRPKLGYRAELDGVRAIAVLLVLVWHSYLLGVTRPIAGFLGVDVFFVLSGYLITSLLVEENASSGSIRVAAFYGRRVLRLTPALLLLLGLGWIASSRTVAAMRYSREALVTAFSGANWFYDRLSVLIHTWSLSIEVQYYVVWPLVLIAALKAGVSRRRLAWATIAIAIAVGVVRTTMYGELDGAALNAYRTYGHLDALMLGNALALAPDLWEWTRRRAVAIAALVVFGGIVLLQLAYEPTFDPRAVYFRGLFSIFVLAVAILVAHITRRPGPLTSFLAHRSLATVGRVSYGLYLFHIPIFVIVASWTTRNVVSLPLGWALTFAAAVFSYTLVERPALDLKSRLVPRGREHVPPWEGARLGEET